MPQDFGKVVYGGYHQNTGLGNALLQGVGAGLSKGLASGVGGFLGDLIHEDPQAALYKEQAANARIVRINTLRDMAGKYMLSNPEMLANPDAMAKWTNDLAGSVGLDEFKDSKHPIWQQISQEADQARMRQSYKPQIASDEAALGKYGVQTPTQQPRSTMPPAATGGGGSSSEGGGGEGFSSAGNGVGPYPPQAPAPTPPPSTGFGIYANQPPQVEPQPTTPQEATSMAQTLSTAADLDSIPTAKAPNISVPPQKPSPQNFADLQAVAYHALSRIKLMDLASNPTLMADPAHMSTITALGASTEKAVKDVADFALAAAGHNPEIGVNYYDLGVQRALSMQFKDAGAAHSLLETLAMTHGPDKALEEFRRLKAQNDHDMAIQAHMDLNPASVAAIDGIAKSHSPQSIPATLSYLSAREQTKVHKDLTEASHTIQRTEVENRKDVELKRLGISQQEVNLRSAEIYAKIRDESLRTGAYITNMRSETSLKQAANHIAMIEAMEKSSGLASQDAYKRVSAYSAAILAIEKQMALDSDPMKDPTARELSFLPANPKERAAAMAKIPNLAEYEKRIQGHRDALADLRKKVTEISNEKLDTITAATAARFKAMGIDPATDKGKASDFLQNEEFKQRASTIIPKLAEGHAMKVALADPNAIRFLLPGVSFKDGKIQGTVLDDNDIAEAVKWAEYYKSTNTMPDQTTFSKQGLRGKSTVGDKYKNKTADMYSAVSTIRKFL